MSQLQYTELMNRSFRGLLIDALKITITRPSIAFRLFKLIRRQKSAANTRHRLMEEQNISVPPFMIFSLTSRCNLRCKGCYAMARKNGGAGEMSMEKVRAVIDEAYDLGVSVCMLAGGEPLVRKEILEITKDYPDMIFPIFTNGTLLDDSIISAFKQQRNVVPVISIEGYEEDTDGRRGEGVFLKLTSAMSRLKEKGIFFGTSLTVTSSNFGTITNDAFIKCLTESGSRLFFFVDYVPVKEGTENWVLTQSKKEELMQLLNEFKRKFRGLFIAFPGDEEKFGGCMSAGRGFIHISSGGEVEPCPFAPWSDVSLKDLSLGDALKSEFLSAIRQNHSQLTETVGGCALWEKREWVYSLINGHTVKEG